MPRRMGNASKTVSPPRPLPLILIPRGRFASFRSQPAHQCCLAAPNPAMRCALFCVLILAATQSPAVGGEPIVADEPVVGDQPLFDDQPPFADAPLLGTEAFAGPKRRAASIAQPKKSRRPTASRRRVNRSWKSSSQPSRVSMSRSAAVITA